MTGTHKKNAKIWVSNMYLYFNNIYTAKKKKKLNPAHLITFTDIEILSFKKKTNYTVNWQSHTHAEYSMTTTHTSCTINHTACCFHNFRLYCYIYHCSLHKIYTFNLEGRKSCSFVNDHIHSLYTGIHLDWF